MEDKKVKGGHWSTQRGWGKISKAGIEEVCLGPGSLGGDHWPVLTMCRGWLLGVEKVEIETNHCCLDVEPLPTVEWCGPEQEAGQGGRAPGSHLPFLPCPLLAEPPGNSWQRDNDLSGARCSIRMQGLDPRDNNLITNMCSFEVPLALSWQYLTGFDCASLELIRILWYSCPKPQASFVSVRQ